ncbi:MAG TPA: hypothetical protein VF792_03510 [Ktedonobacterales bacterium]
MRWIHSRKVVLLSAAVLALSGCGSASASHASIKVTATPVPTYYAPAPTATPTASCASGGNGNAQYTPSNPVGGLLVSPLSDSGLQTSAFHITAGTATKPLEVPDRHSNPGTDPTLINPGLSAEDGYLFIICNPSSAAITLQSISARIASFSPYSGPLAAWNPCADGTYYAPQQTALDGGCGGGFFADVLLQANFPASAGVGATASGTQVSSTLEYKPLPLSLAPGKWYQVVIGVTPPTTAGTYTFSLGLTVGASSAPAYFATGAPALFAPVTQEWNGRNCTAATMKAQIPTSSQSYYICPPA